MVVSFQGTAVNLHLPRIEKLTDLPLPEIAEGLVNPVEGLILAHQPVNGHTWLAAKLTHLIRIVVYQQVSSRTGEYETREIQRFEPGSGKYHKWVFSSDGSNSFWIGSWNGQSSTMTWESVDFGAGLQGRIVDRFTGGGKYESTVLMKNSAGKVLLDVRSVQTRMKKPAK